MYVKKHSMQILCMINRLVIKSKIDITLEKIPNNNIYEIGFLNTDKIFKGFNEDIFSTNNNISRNE